MKNPIVEFLDALHRGVETIHSETNSIQIIAQQAIDTMKPISEAASELHQSFATPRLALGLTTRFAEIDAKLRETLRAMPGRMKQAFQLLGESGWYIGSNTPPGFLFELGEALEQGDIDRAEMTLVSYYRSESLTILSFLVEKFPARERPLRAAFAAHERGEFELAIPVFLAQADGICFELIGIQLFRRSHGAPATARYVKSFPEDSIRAALLHPLNRVFPISAASHERDESFDALNRHQILHGEISDYGSEINSLKAMSLLDYISQVLWHSEHRQRAEDDVP